MILAIRAPYAFRSSPAELKVFSSFRVRKAMSNGLSHFRYALGNGLSDHIKERKLNLSGARRGPSLQQTLG